MVKLKLTCKDYLSYWVFPLTKHLYKSYYFARRNSLLPSKLLKRARVKSVMLANVN
jgi:hypothetical protein